MSNELNNNSNKKYPAYCKFCAECVNLVYQNEEYDCPSKGFDKLDPHVLNCNAD